MLPRRPLAGLASVVTLAAAPAVAEAPSVVTDIAPVHSIAARVMEGSGAVPHLLLPPGASPHDFAMRPSDAAALEAAGLVIWVGEGLTPWLHDPLDRIAAGATILELMETDGWTVLEAREIDGFGPEGDGHDDHDKEHDETHDDHGHDHDDDHAEGHDDHGHDDRGHGHDHGGADPHAWLDPAVGALWAAAIADALAAADPDQAELYRDNAAALAADLGAAEARMTAALGPLAGSARYLVAHDSYVYFEERFGLTPTGAVTLSDDADPGPRHVADLRAAAQDGGIACILAGAEGPTGWADLIAEGTGVKVIEANILGAAFEPGPALYPALIDDLAAAFEACLTP